MRHLNLNTISSFQPLGHALGEVYGTVLASRAAEGDLKVVAAGVQFCQCGNAASSNVANCQYSIRPCILHWKLKLTTGNIYTLATLSSAGVAAQRFAQYGFGIARQSNTKPPPLPVLSSGNPRLYEKDRMVTFMPFHFPRP